MRHRTSTDAHPTKAPGQPHIPTRCPGVRVVLTGHGTPAEQGLSSPQDGEKPSSTGFQVPMGFRGVPGVSVPSTRTPKTRYIRPLFTADVTGFEHPPARPADTAFGTSPSTTSVSVPSSAGSNLPDKLGTS